MELLYLVLRLASVVSAATFDSNQPSYSSILGMMPGRARNACPISGKLTLLP